MNNTFEIGEVVVCINAKRRWYRLGGLTKNEMYTVVGFNPYDGGLILDEVKSKRSGHQAYRADRFRKVDYSFANRVLKNLIPQKEEVEQLEFAPQKFELALLN